MDKIKLLFDEIRAEKKFTDSEIDIFEKLIRKFVDDPKNISKKDFGKLIDNLIKYEELMLMVLEPEK